MWRVEKESHWNSVIKKQTFYPRMTYCWTVMEEMMS